MHLSADVVKAAREQLLTDGFCVVDGGLSEGRIDVWREWSDRWLGSMTHPDRWRYQGSDIHLMGERNVSRRSPNLPKDSIVDELIEHPKAIMDALQMDDFKSGGTYQIISKPGQAPALYWHQDWGRWDDPVSLSPWPQQVFLNWYLTDTTRENGCLRVIPGSHLKRIDLHDNLVAPHEGGGYEVEETNEWMFMDHPAAIDVAVKTGQLVIGDARVLHGTWPNEAGERRTVLLGWFYRRDNEAPAGWDRGIPREIADRDPETPMVFNREPGKYLR